MEVYFKLMRIHHYIKNLLIFAALACSGQLLDFKKLSTCIIAFFAFCMIASVVYIINDIRDKENDQKHPVKCNRPIASEKVSLNNAKILIIVLLIVAVSCNYIVFNITASLLLLLYLILNLAYSFGLKSFPIVDVTILVSGFLIRVLYGALITNISVSNWLYLTIIALSFYFAFGKRRNELKQVGKNTRQVLKAYTVNFLDKNMYMCLTLSNVFYALWSMDKQTIAFYNNKYLIYTVPIVLIITMKYSLNIKGDSDGDPVEVLIHDKTLMGLCIFYFVIMFTVLYL